MSHLFFEENKILNFYFRRLIEKNTKDPPTRNIEKIPNLFHNPVYGKNEIHPEQVDRSSSKKGKQNRGQISCNRYQPCYSETFYIIIYYSTNNIV